MAAGDCWCCRAGAGGSAGRSLATRRWYVGSITIAMLLTPGGDTARSAVRQTAYGKGMVTWVHHLTKSPADIGSF